MNKCKGINVTGNIYWVYILMCQNNSYYTGITNDVEKRFKLHQAGKGAKYTRSLKPILIAQSWEVKHGKSVAMKVERFIKNLPRQRKEEIIARSKKNPEPFESR
jgi:putative endonuclease